MTMLLFILGGGLMAWLGFRMIKGNPAVFSKSSLSKSVYTLGILALILIAVVMICVKILGA
ncbi:MAG: hypothetical protein COB66_08625 [Coxiella sp. (in: Bacteria)]|nr:MAG: hypothetical protein COB66_08625 [Coxiella sp. (in: g-proteobacteria)]